MLDNSFQLRLIIVLLSETEFTFDDALQLRLMILFQQIENCCIGSSAIPSSEGDFEMQIAFQLRLIVVSWRKENCFILSGKSISYIPKSERAK